MKLIPDPANQLAPHNKSNWLWTAEGLCWSAAEEIFHTALCLSTVTLPGKARGGKKKPQLLCLREGGQVIWHRRSEARARSPGVAIPASTGVKGPEPPPDTKGRARRQTLR